MYVDIIVLVMPHHADSCNPITTLSICQPQELRAVHNDEHESPELHIRGSKFLVVLPSLLVRSFFAPTIANIVTCLGDIRRNSLLGSLQYVFLVGGFSSSPLVQVAARAELQFGGCEVVSALRPDVAIVRGAVLFANNAKTFTSRKARLTYGIVVSNLYDHHNPEHVRRRSATPWFDEDGKERIAVFDHHIKVGEDISQDGVCPIQLYHPLWSTQSTLSIKVLASHKNNVAFPDEDSTFPLGQVGVPLDMTASFEKRGVEVSRGTRSTLFFVSVKY